EEEYNLFPHELGSILTASPSIVTTPSNKSLLKVTSKALFLSKYILERLLPLSTSSKQKTTGPLCNATLPAFSLISGCDFILLTGIGKSNSISSPVSHKRWIYAYPFLSTSFIFIRSPLTRSSG